MSQQNVQFSETIVEVPPFKEPSIIPMMFLVLAYTVGFFLSVATLFFVDWFFVRVHFGGFQVAFLGAILLLTWSAFIVAFRGVTKWYLHHHEPMPKVFLDKVLAIRWVKNPPPPATTQATSAVITSAPQALKSLILFIQDPDEPSNLKVMVQVTSAGRKLLNNDRRVYFDPRIKPAHREKVNLGIDTINVVYLKIDDKTLFDTFLTKVGTGPNSRYVPTDLAEGILIDAHTGKPVENLEFHDWLQFDESDEAKAAYIAYLQYVHTTN